MHLQMTTGDWINSVLALMTALMAGGTGYLAWVTHTLAKGTAEGIKQADRHHQENLRPFCLIVFADATDQHPFGPEFDAAGQASPTVPLRIRGDIQNKGRGPANDVLIYFNARRGAGETGAYRLTRPVVVSGLISAEETIAVDVAVTDRDVMHAWDEKRWQPTQIISTVASDTYEVVLEYRDVFGNVFRTVHPRGIWTNALIPDLGSVEKRSELMIRQNKSTPIFLTGRQPVQTLADLPPMPVVAAQSDPEARPTSF